MTEVRSAAVRAASCVGGSEVPTDTFSAVGGSMGRKDDWRLMVCLVGRLSKVAVGHGVGVQK